MNSESQPVAVAIIEAKAETKPANHGLEQAKLYASSKRLNVPFVFSSNGHQFICYDRNTGMTSRPLPLSEFPTPAELRVRYEQYVGFSLEESAARPLLARYTGGEGTRRWLRVGGFGDRFRTHFGTAAARKLDYRDSRLCAPEAVNSRDVIP